jgi:DNA modification methylase
MPDQIKPYYADESVTLYHGDCREILPDLDDAGPQIWITDPPYSSGGFQEAGRSNGSIGKMGIFSRGDRIDSDSLSTRGYTLLLRDTLRWSRGASEIAIFTDWRMWTTTTDALEYAGWTIRAMVVWSKPNNGIGRPWRNQHELIAYGMRGAASKDRIAKQGNVIQCSRSGNENHPTEKPEELLGKIIDNMADGIVVDPFAGSGSGLVAAKRLGRSAIGIEQDERYCEIAAARLSQGVLDFSEPA